MPSFVVFSDTSAQMKIVKTKSFYTPPHVSGGFYVFTLIVRVSVRPSVRPSVRTSFPFDNLSIY